MISEQAGQTIHNMTEVLERIEHDAEEEAPAPVLSDIRAMRRDLDQLERDVLDSEEHDSNVGDAC
jgi:hypothetical protein